MRNLPFALLAAMPISTHICCLLILPVAAWPQENLLLNPGFESGVQAWRTLGSPRYQVLAAAGRNGSKGLRYQKLKDDGGPKENSHFDQEVDVEPQSFYVASAWVNAGAGLRPVLRIATMDWATLALAIAEPKPGWQEIRTQVKTGQHKRLRFQLFLGAKTDRRESAIGTTRCDDAVLRKCSPQEMKAMRSCNVTVDVGKRLRPVNPLFFGVNSLFWIETDQAVADGKIAKQLRAMPCTLLRYPAGEAADNYHWKTHTLNNKKRWPSRDTPDNMDTDEFMAWRSQIGAEPIFVVNLESCYVNGDPAAGPKEAAEWVRYCNKDKGYNVRYWEIGNETYLKGTYFPMTAKQYADAFVKFAKAMKAVDPTIQIGAIGPMGIDAPAAIERNKRGPAWWPTVLDAAGDLLGFVVVHRYYNVADYQRFEWGALRVDEPIAKLRSLLEERYPGRYIPIALTEWNTWRKTKARGIAQALMVAELIGRYLEGGVDMANFWPMRLTGKKSTFRSLLDSDTNEPRPPYHVMKLFASNLAQGWSQDLVAAPMAKVLARASHLVQADASSVQVYTCAGLSADGRKLAVFLVNKSTWPQGMEVKVSIAGFPTSAAEMTTLTAPALGSEDVVLKTLTLKPIDGQMQLKLPPHSLTVVQVHE